MGYFSELDIERQEIDAIEATEERRLDFDQRNYLDGAWWTEQDAELHDEEMKQLESDAEIFDLQRGGYL